MIEFDIDKILVPVDFSPSSLNALETAVCIARRHDASILLVHVVETSGLAGGQPYDGGGATTLMTHHAEQELLVLQHSVIERYLVSCEIVCCNGIVSSGIIKVSDSHRADMIVMGTHGSSGFRESFIGLNAFNVVKGAACPVLTVPPTRKFDSFKKLLFPVRPIPGALDKYDVLRNFIRKEDAKLKILGLATDYEKDGMYLKELTKRLYEKLILDQVESSTYFKVGNNMADEVLKISELIDADMVVITTTMDPSYKQFFIGPYTQQIINRSRIPILSVKPRVAQQDMEEVMEYGQPLHKKIPLYN